LVNLSILAPLVSGEAMTVGTVLGGAGTSGAKTRAVSARRDLRLRNSACPACCLIRR